jgi:hypothetical protein
LEVKDWRPLAQGRLKRAGGLELNGIEANGQVEDDGEGYKDEWRMKQESK